MNIYSEIIVHIEIPLRDVSSICIRHLYKAQLMYYIKYHQFIQYEKYNYYDSTAITNIIRFLLSFFVSFTDFEGEYSLYLTEKCVKMAEKDSEKMVM